jgi:exopolyphosphatase/guanosine-5'-triphosphate,3'-diphosphate pyrophosphatase
MNRAVIDIGTNTLLMVVIDENLNIIDDFQEIARLGEGVDKNRVISKDAIDRAKLILRKYRTYLQDNNISQVIGIGTSALRDSNNREEVVRELEESLGFQIKVISGEEEAKYTFLGSIDEQDEATVIDIGGGSTEIVSGTKEKLNFRISLDIGAVRIAERFTGKPPFEKTNHNKAKEFVNDELSKIDVSKISKKIIAVAGTPTSLAQIALGKNYFKTEEINNYKFASKDLTQITKMIAEITPIELIERYNIHPNRADILASGAIILDEFIAKLNTTDFTVSTNGLRYGYAKDITNFN